MNAVLTSSLKKNNSTNSSCFDSNMNNSIINSWKNNRHLLLFLSSLLITLFMLPLSVSAVDAPIITAGSITNAVPGTSSVMIPVTVKNFSNIGKFTLTMVFDTLKVKYVSSITNPAFNGMTVTFTPPVGNTQGKLVFAWLGTSNISIADGSNLANITFSYVNSTGILSWAYNFGAICQYKSYIGGVLTLLNDSPKYLFYKNGGISDRSAPVTFASNITNPIPGIIQIPITANGCTNIGAITLNLEYDTTIIRFQNSFTTNPAFNSSFLVGDNVGTGSKKVLVIQWYGNAINLANGSTICTLNFNYLTAGGSCPLTWSDNGPSCEYTDASGSVLIDIPTADYYKNGGVAMPSINMLLKKGTNCGEFTVALKPSVNIQANLSKTVFTVKWAANSGSDIQLKDINTNYTGMQQLGSRVLYGGNYYVTFQSTTNFAVNWLANSENTIMTFRHSGTGVGNGDFTIIPSDYNSVAPGVNTAYYTEIASVNATGSITNDANSFSLNCGLYVKDFLQGSYNISTHLMNTNLLTGNYLPLNQPYSSTQWLYSGSEHVVTFPSGTVDWVLVELRTGTAANTSIGRRVGLLKNDGTLMDTNGTSPLVFHSFIPGNAYYVVVYHRNHLPVMSKNAISLPNTSATKLDFTINPTTNVYTVTNDGVILLETGIYGQIVGDLNADNKLKYSGSGSDRGIIISKINLIYSPPPATLNSTISGYFNEDLNMNGIVKYSGPQNDQNVIYSNIDALTNPTTLNSVYTGQVPVNYSFKSLQVFSKFIKHPSINFLKINP